MAEKCEAEKTADPEPQTDTDKSFEAACDQVKTFVEEQTKAPSNHTTDNAEFEKEAPESGIPEDATKAEDEETDSGPFLRRESRKSKAGRTRDDNG